MFKIAFYSTIFLYILIQILIKIFPLTSSLVNTLYILIMGVITILNFSGVVLVLKIAQYNLSFPVNVPEFLYLYDMEDYVPEW